MYSLPPDGYRLARYVRAAPTVRRLARLAWHVAWFALVFKILIFI